MTWLSVVSALLAIARLLLERAERNGAIAEGESRAALRSIEESNARIQKALAARRTARSDGMSDDDPYLRD